MSRLPRSALWPVRDDRTLSAYAKLAYYTLWTRQPDIHPSMKTLGADMGCSERSAQRAVRELESVGLLKVASRTTVKGDPDSNQFLLLPMGGASQSPPPVSEAPPPVPESHPKNASSRTQVKGENSRASRRARPAVTRAEVIGFVRRAVSISYSADEADEVSDGQAVALWLLLVSDRTPADPVKYLCKIFEETPYLDTHLANAGHEEDWT